MAARKWHIIVKDQSNSTVYESYIQANDALEIITAWPSTQSVVQVKKHVFVLQDLYEYVVNNQLNSILFEKV